MVSATELTLSFVLNSLWQVPVIFLAAALSALFLRNTVARYRHTLWLVALLLSIIIPMLSAAQLMPTAVSIFYSATPTDSTSIVTQHPTDNIKVDEENRPVAQPRSIDHEATVVNTSENNAGILTLLYALFIVACATRFGRLWYRKERLRGSLSFELPKHIHIIFTRCTKVFGVKNVAIARSSVARVPCTIGHRRPIVVLPEAFCSDMDEETLLSVVAHEVAHVSRNDFFTKVFCEALSLPVSFHPLVILMKRKIERERELACDELVINLVTTPQSYARSLVNAADVSMLPATRSLMLSVFDGRMLEERIMKLTRKQFRLGKRSGRLLTATALLILLVISLCLPVLSFEFKTQAQAVFAQVNLSIADPSFAVIAERTREQPPATITRTNDSTAQARAEAACAAGKLNEGEGIPTLIALLGDDSKSDLLKCWQSNWSPAIQTFKQSSPGEQAALVLASMGRTAFPALANQLINSNASVRRNAAWAIGELTGMVPGERSSAGPQLTTLLHDSDLWVRIAAARSLGEIRDRRASETLMLTLSDSDWRVREMAAWALSEMKDKRAVQALGTVLVTDTRAEVRRGAAEALGEIKSAEALPFLRQALNDPEARVSNKARWAIDEIEDTE